MPRFLFMIVVLSAVSPLLRADDAAPAPLREERRDPFRMTGDDVPGSRDGLVHAEAQLVPNGIRIKGILRIKGRDPVAIISVPGGDGDYHVREGEVVRIEVGSPRGSAPAGRTASPSRSPESLPQSMRGNPALRGGGSGPEPRPSAASGNRATPAVFYLFISKINKMSIEAYPKTRPDAKQIFR